MLQYFVLHLLGNLVLILFVIFLYHENYQLKVDINFFVFCSADKLNFVNKILQIHDNLIPSTLMSRPPIRNTNLWVMGWRRSVG